MHITVKIDVGVSQKPCPDKKISGYKFVLRNALENVQLDSLEPSFAAKKLAIRTAKREITTDVAVRLLLTKCLRQLR